MPRNGRRRKETARLLGRKDFQHPLRESWSDEARCPWRRKLTGWCSKEGGTFLSKCYYFRVY